jgi:hypothetical protein
MSKYGALITAPGPKAVNAGASASRVSTKNRLLGAPIGELSQDCDNGKASAKVRRLCETRDVGPFRATGLKPWLTVLERTFRILKVKDLALWQNVGTAGTLCPRNTRGGDFPSSHSYGTATDLTIDGVVDPRGDDRIQQGLLVIYGCFKQACKDLGWPPVFWGVEFPTEDAMHFEASEELLRFWAEKDLI